MKRNNRFKDDKGLPRPDWISTLLGMAMVAVAALFFMYVLPGAV